MSSVRYRAFSLESHLHDRETKKRLLESVREIEVLNETTLERASTEVNRMDKETIGDGTAVVSAKASPVSWSKFLFLVVVVEKRNK